MKKFLWFLLDLLLWFITVGLAFFLGMALAAAPVTLSLTANAITNRYNVSLGWNVSTNALVAGYNLYQWPSGDGVTNPPLAKVTVPGRTNSQCIFSNLPANAAYDWRATTFSAAGAESALSLPVSYATPTVPVTTFTARIAAPGHGVYIWQQSADLKNWKSFLTTTGTVTVTLTNDFSRVSFCRAVTN